MSNKDKKTSVIRLEKQETYSGGKRPSREPQPPRGGSGNSNIRSTSQNNSSSPERKK